MLAVSAAFAFAPSAARADTYAVDTTSDHTPGSCTAGDCTLREAITAANATTVADTLTLPAGHYVLEPQEGGTDAGYNQLTIKQPLTIQGAGAGDTIVDANRNPSRPGPQRYGRVFSAGPDQYGGGGNGPVYLNDLTVTGGKTYSGTYPYPSGNGAGIFNALNTGSLYLTRVVVTGNDASQSSSGGAIANDGHLSLTDVTIDDNTASSGAAGGIYQSFSGATTGTGVTFSHNNADSSYGPRGRGEAFYNSGGTVTLSNATFAENNSNTFSGDVFYNAGGTASLKFVTFADNAAPGFAIRTDGGTVNLQDTLVSGSTCGGNASVTSLGYNLEANPAPGLCNLTGEGDHVVDDAHLGRLRDNGGPTKTIALLSEPGERSTALDAGGPLDPSGDCAGAPIADQRGEPRMKPDNPFPPCDIGAYELVSTPPHTVLDHVPPYPTNDPDEYVAFSGGPSYECAETSFPEPRESDFAPCTSPYAIDEPTVGWVHHLWIRALDASGNVDQSPVGVDFLLDSEAPDTTITAGPSGSTSDATPTFAFASSEPASSFECSPDGHGFAACASPLTIGPLATGSHSFRVRARDAADNLDPTPASRSYSVTATVSPPADVPAADRDGDGVPDPVDACPTVPARTAQGCPERLGPPQFRLSANVVPVSGKLRIRCPGDRGFGNLGAERQLRFGCTIDATQGRVRVVTATPPGIGGSAELVRRGFALARWPALVSKGGTQSADFYQGAFVLTQDAKGVTGERLTAGSFASCKKKGGKRSSAAARKRRVRRLWGSGKGRYRTKGRYAAGIVRGTTWLVEDRCEGTFVRVKKGKLDVQDLVRHRTFRLKAPKGRLVRPKRR